MNIVFSTLGRWLAAYLNRPTRAPYTHPPANLPALREMLQPADVLLVEGDRRISTAIKYLTQSTWSHAVIYVGPRSLTPEAPPQPCFVEADTEAGVHLVPLDTFAKLHVRLCRPIGLTPEDTARVVDYVCSRIGDRYDLKNVWDLARYLLPNPPVPSRWRRRMLALGSGDPTRAICSSLIAEAFHSVRFPILPLIETLPDPDGYCADCVRELLHIRHHSLFVPRDFDVSPYFAVIKPNTVKNFDYRRMNWAAES